MQSLKKLSSLVFQWLSLEGQKILKQTKDHTKRPGSRIHRKGQFCSRTNLSFMLLLFPQPTRCVFRQGSSVIKAHLELVKWCPPYRCTMKTKWTQWFKTHHTVLGIVHSPDPSSAVLTLTSWHPHWWVCRSLERKMPIICVPSIFH